MSILKFPRALRGLIAAPAVIRSGRLVGRARTRDVAYSYRMGAGFAGDVNRMHPASIEAAKIDPTNPPTFFGQPVLANGAANSVRAFLATDTAVTDAYGVTVRPFPTQQATASLAYAQANFGSGGPSTAQALDVLRSGYILVPVVGATTKGGAVFIWVTASSGAHVQGGFEAAANGVNTIALPTTKFQWNGPADANGIAELAFNV